MINTARELITEASKKLTNALQHKGQENIQSVKVAQLMLSAGNDKLSNAAKQLAELQKEKLQEKLCREWSPLPMSASGPFGSSCGPDYFLAGKHHNS